LFSQEEHGGKKGYEKIDSHVSINFIHRIFDIWFGKIFNISRRGCKYFWKDWGSPIQYFTGVYELLAAILVMVSSTAFIGATLILIAMVGAVFLHIFILGFEGFFLVLFVIAIILIFISLKVMRERRRDLFR